ADALAVHVALTGNLLGGRQYGLDLAQVHQHRARILALLDHAGHDVALMPGVLAERHLIFDVTQPLQDHLTGGRGRDPAEAGGRIVVLPRGRAIDTGVPRPHRDVAGLPVYFHAGRGARALGLVVRHQQRVLDRLDDRFERDVLLTLEAAQHAQVNVHRR